MLQYIYNIVLLKIKDYQNKIHCIIKIKQIGAHLVEYKRSFIHSIFPGGSEVKASASNVRDMGSIPGSGRSPGEGNGNPLQYSCLENPMDGEAWWDTVHGVAKSRTRLSDFTHLLTEKDLLVKNKLFTIVFLIRNCVGSSPT